MFLLAFYYILSFACLGNGIDGSHKNLQSTKTFQKSKSVKFPDSNNVATPLITANMPVEYQTSGPEGIRKIGRSRSGGNRFSDSDYPMPTDTDTNAKKENTKKRLARSQTFSVNHVIERSRSPIINRPTVTADTNTNVSETEFERQRIANELLASAIGFKTILSESVVREFIFRKVSANLDYVKRKWTKEKIHNVCKKVVEMFGLNIWLHARKGEKTKEIIGKIDDQARINNSVGGARTVKSTLVCRVGENKVALVVRHITRVKAEEPKSEFFFIAKHITAQPRHDVYMIVGKMHYEFSTDKLVVDDTTQTVEISEKDDSEENKSDSDSSIEALGASLERTLSLGNRKDKVINRGKKELTKDVLSLQNGENKMPK